MPEVSNTPSILEDTNQVLNQSSYYVLCGTPNLASNSKCMMMKWRKQNQKEIEMNEGMTKITWNQKDSIDHEVENKDRHEPDKGKGVKPKNNL